MAKLPDPSLINRRTPTPGGPAGYLRPTHIGTPGADTSIGDALMGIGDEAYKFAMIEKARMDGVAFDDAQNQYLLQKLDLEAEYSKIEAKNAVDQDIVKDYNTKLDGISENLSSGFKNDSQRRSWDSYYKKAKVQFTAGVMKHKLNESDVYASSTYKSTNITRMQNAHSNWADAGVVNNSASDIVKNIAKEKERVGWGDERTEVELKTALGPLWSGVAAQYINAKQYKMAKKILDQHQDVIGVDKYTSYHKSIETSETIDLSQEHADRIFKDIDGNAAQIKEARETLSGQLEETTIKQIKIRQNEERIQRKEVELRKKQEEIAKKNLIIEQKNEIANDLFELEKNNDLPGRLEYINTIPAEFGSLKRKELDAYEKDLKESQKAPVKKPWNKAEKDLIYKMTFTPGSVSELDVREAGQDAINRKALEKIRTDGLKKGDAQKNIEKRLKVFHEGIIEEAGPWFGELSEEDAARLESTYYNQLDTIRNWFEQNPKASYSDAQDAYNKIVRPEIAKQVIDFTVRNTAGGVVTKKMPTQPTKPETIKSILQSLKIRTTDLEVNEIAKAFKDSPGTPINENSIKFALDQLRNE